MLLCIILFFKLGTHKYSIDFGCAAFYKGHTIYAHDISGVFPPSFFFVMSLLSSSKGNVDCCDMLAVLSLAFFIFSGNTLPLVFSFGLCCGACDSYLDST